MKLTLEQEGKEELREVEGGEHKTAVFGMKERKGEVRATPVLDCKRTTLEPIIDKNVSKDAVIMIDEWTGYRGLQMKYKNHYTVNHSTGEYVKDIAHTNTIEGFWSLLKRGIIGIYHQVSPKHLHRYVDEFTFR